MKRKRKIGPKLYLLLRSNTGDGSDKIISPTVSDTTLSARAQISVIAWDSFCEFTQDGTTIYDTYIIYAYEKQSCSVGCGLEHVGYQPASLGRPGRN